VGRKSRGLHLLSVRRRRFPGRAARRLPDPRVARLRRSRGRSRPARPHGHQLDTRTPRFEPRLGLAARRTGRRDTACRCPPRWDPDRVHRRRRRRRACGDLP